MSDLQKTARPSASLYVRGLALLLWAITYFFVIPFAVYQPLVRWLPDTGSEVVGYVTQWTALFAVSLAFAWLARDVFRYLWITMGAVTLGNLILSAVVVVRSDFGASFLLSQIGLSAAVCVAGWLVQRTRQRDAH